MKIAILSDIHANLHALQAVLDDLARARPDSLMCLGDLVGYGAFPNEVVDLVRSRNMPCLLGNNDEAVGFDLKDSGSGNRSLEADRLSQASLRWTRAHTSPERKEFLRRLPIQIREEAAGARLLFVHGSPRRINECLYEDRPEATFQHIAKLAGCDVLLFGHTHLPYQKWVGRTLFVNAGSVGRPKDGDPRAGYALLDLSSLPARAGNRCHRVEFRRVAYDVRAAAAAVREAGLPPQLADLLESGGAAPILEPRAAAPQLAPA